MKDKQSDMTTTRRSFLKGTLTAGAATLVGAAVGQAQAAPVSQPQEAAKPGQQGYHETRHIRDYYAKARI